MNFSMRALAITTVVGAALTSSASFAAGRGHDSEKVDLTKERIETLREQLEEMKADSGHYPTDDKWISVQDGWHHNFLYKSDGRHYSLKSLGKDHREGGVGEDMDLVGSK